MAAYKQTCPAQPLCPVFPTRLATLAQLVDTQGASYGLLLENICAAPAVGWKPGQSLALSH